MNQHDNYQAPYGNPNTKIAVLAGAVIALLAACIYLFVQLDKTRQDFDKRAEATRREIEALRESSSVTAQNQKRTVETLRDELETARRSAAMAVGQAKTEAEAKVKNVQARLDSEAKKLSEAQARAEQSISEVKKDAAETVAKVGEVKTEVGAVKTEVASAKSEIDKTIADLKRVTGDLGVQSGLIATNSKEISALRALGERNIFEFDLKKTKDPVRVGDVAMLLKRVDLKRNRYTIELVADDKRTEKKDKSLNEPVQFYTSKARMPYEIVVNRVNKDNIVGYLSTPKVTDAR